MRSPIYLHHHEVKAYMKSHWTKFYKYIHTKFVNLNPFAKSKVWNHSLFHHILTFWELNPLGTYHVLRTVQMSKWAYKSDLANVHLMIVTTVRVLVHVIGAWQVLLSATLHYNPNFQVLSKNHHAYFYYKLVKYDSIWYRNKLAVLKSVNLQYNTLGRMDDGTNESSSKRFAKILWIYFLIFL